MKVKNIQRKVSLLVGLAWCIAALNVLPVQVQAQAPLPLGITDLRSSADGFEAVWRDADTSKTNSSSLGYASGGLETKTFTATLIATDAADRLAIFSDDGCDVSITDVTPGIAVTALDFGGKTIRYLANYNVGQALAALNQSLHALVFIPTVDHTYRITIRYSNAYYTADGSDIDGVKLYAYRNVQAAPPLPPRTVIALNADRISSSGAHLYWTEVPVVDNFSSYTLFFSPSPLNTANLAAATRKLNAVTTRTLTEFTDSGLQPDTDYFYALRVRYTNNSEQTIYKSFKTLAITTPRLSFTQNLRTCAGHIKDSVHEITATVDSILSGQNGAANTPAKGIKYKLSFENNVPDENTPGGLKGAGFLVMENGAEVEKKEIEVTSTNDADATTSSVSFTVLSSNKITKDIRVRATYTDAQNVEHEAGVVACDFAVVESKRHFGIVAPESANDNALFDEGFSQDTGWRITRADDTEATPTIQPYVATPQIVLGAAAGNTILYKGEVFLRFALKPEQPASRLYFLSSNNTSAESTASDAAPRQSQRLRNRLAQQSGLSRRCRPSATHQVGRINAELFYARSAAAQRGYFVFLRCERQRAGR